MSYTADDIKTLSFHDGVRQRIQMYLGSADNEGAYQAFKEILNNATDEALSGYGKIIDISINEESNNITVRDYGRGVPFLVKEDGTNVLVDIFTKAHTGGKFDNRSYKNVSGLNGVGGSCVCLSSLYFDVHSYRDGIVATATFKEGNLIEYTEEKTKEKNGTLISFIPDPKVFKDEEIHYNFEDLCEKIKAISYLCNGIAFNITNSQTKEKVSYCAKNGIVDFIKDNITKPLHKHIITERATDGIDSIEIAFQWGVPHEKSCVFVNGLLCSEGGSPITGAKTAITKTFNNLAKIKIDGEQIRQNLFYVINCNVNSPSFANQTKTKINNASLRTLTSNAFTTALKRMYEEYQEEFNIIKEMLKKVQKAELAAEKVRQQILNNEKEQVKAQKTKILNVDKLCDARTLGEDSVLLCVEGNSAGGSMKIGRDANKYGILMLRGKCKNLLNCDIEEGLQNEEVKLFQQALGIIYGRKSSKLRYGKVAIASDADPDGSHIGLLILSIAYVLYPSLLEENRLYWLRAPIYKVETSSETYFYYTEEEFKAHPNGNIVKFKGLGQMQEEDLKNSMFNPKWQRLEPITFSKEGIQELIDLMGKNIEKRKEFVYNNINFNDFMVE